jgi:acetolactate synthase-1/2/3 large subunit
MSAPTCAEVLARTLREAGITRMFGLPGGEVLDLIEAARREGIEFLLTRHEAAASFMADVTGQIQRRPGVCVATLGPGAVNMTLGVANAFLDRSPLLAITATLAHRNAGIATHQDLDLNALYRPITKLTLTIDGHDTAGKVRRALEVSMTPRMGPVHLTLPSDIAKTEDRQESERAARSSAPAAGSPEALDRVADRITGAARAAIVIGIDVNPLVDTPAVRAFAEALGAPVFVTPKAKGIFPEDHPLFFGVCAGVSGDAVVCEWLGRADVLVGVGFDPVESDKVWHHTMPLVSIGPMSIATSQFQPVAEAVGDLPSSLATLTTRLGGKTFAGTPGDRDRFRTELETVLRPASRPRGLSGFELTRRLRERFPRDTICVTDVGSVKMVTSQAWTAYEPLTFFESNGLSAMSYGFPGAMAARLQFPTRPILCTIGDGGFGMTIAELETSVRAGLHFVTVVYNDSSLSLIDVAQERRGYPTTGVRHGRVDFAAAAAAFGAWSRRVETMDELEAALADSAAVDRPIVIDAVVDPAEYRAHTRPRDQV